MKRSIRGQSETSDGRMEGDSHGRGGGSSSAGRAALAMSDESGSGSASTSQTGVPLAFLNYAQAAAFLNVNINTLYWWVHTKKLRHIRYSKRMVMFRLEDLERFNANHTVEAAAKVGAP